MLFCHLLIFFKINFFDFFLSGISSVSNSIDPDKAQHFDGPDLDPNCLLKLSADVKVIVSWSDIMPCNKIVRERSGSVVVLDSRPSDCGFEPHRHHCVVSLSKTHLSLLSPLSSENLVFTTKMRFLSNFNVM